MTQHNSDLDDWDLVLQPRTRLFNLQLKEFWRYRYLIGLLVRRDFITYYQQTILGPLWYVLQPLLTTLVFVVIFGKIAKIPTDQTPPLLFYLSGTVAWNYFSSCTQQTSQTFLKNSGIFSTLYFPRFTVPVATVLINLCLFFIQFILFLCIYSYFLIKGMTLEINLYVLCLPLLIAQMAFLGMGVGCFVSALTRKYRDLSLVMGFAVQLWMFLTPIVYPASIIPKRYLWIFMCNPMAPIIEMFRHAFLGRGIVEINYILAGWVTTFFIFVTGVILFHSAEKNAMDAI